MTVTVTASSGTVGTTGTNTIPISLGFTPVTSGSDYVSIELPAGWTFVNSSTVCGNSIVNSPQGAFFCNGLGTNTIILNRNGTALSTSLPISFEFGAGTLNVGTSRTFTVSAGVAPSTVKDSGTANLAGGSAASSTVTFDANGGTGTTAAQTASAATALTSNGFTRSGYTFAGWNTAADGTGTAYADAASYSFASSTTLYAQWTATLANTGFDAQPYLLVSSLFGVLGVAVLLLSARRRQAS